MKKKYLLLVAIPVILFSCNGNNIDTPQSPFDDHYQRIGMNSSYTITGDMTDEDFDTMKTSVNDGDPSNVSCFKHEIETRDLKYAYFGQESSTVSQCSMLSQIEDSKRYSNKVTIDVNNAERQVQTANAGVIKTTSKVSDYTFIFDYKEDNPSSPNYRQTSRTEREGEPVEEKMVTEIGTITETTFNLMPLAKIKSTHFTIEGFNLLGANVVSGITNDGYLIKEGYSVFRDFTTTMGRSYKAEDNYFYEGLLEKYTTPENEEAFRLKYFRFYHELLILSKAFDGTGVPVLYLDKPVLIEYGEDQYWISYTDTIPLERYDGEVPLPVSLER